MMKLVVLISGRGSNLQAILDAQLPVEIAAVISNRPDAAGLDLARARGIPALALDHKQYASREAFDNALIGVIDRYQPELVVLAGYLRILGDSFVMHYAGRLMNIHPSLLPSFPGLDTHARALAEGVKIHGCTVHFVTPMLDHGPIIVQAAVPVHSNDTAATLAARVLAAEHCVYPKAIAWFAQGRLLLLDNGQVNLRDDSGSEQTLFISGSLP
ncbi:phosphoribosylglycinamide formyltransferase [Sulfuriferula sp. GW1]|uniref:phosphoribosylglycinamide formyltransferase n=1 Tax=Sulfuriferula sp. GW1 TaxID=3345111 RepID=UPI0039AF3D88